MANPKKDALFPAVRSGELKKGPLEFSVAVDSLSVRAIQVEKRFFTRSSTCTSTSVFGACLALFFSTAAAPDSHISTEIFLVNLWMDG